MTALERYDGTRLIRTQRIEKWQLYFKLVNENVAQSPLPIPHPTSRRHEMRTPWQFAAGGRGDVSPMRSHVAPFCLTVT